LTVLFVQRQQFDVYTTYCLRKTAAEQCIDELGGDHNGFLQVRIAAAASLKGTLHSVEKTLIQKAYCVYYYILKERRFFYVD